MGVRLWNCGRRGRTVVGSGQPHRHRFGVVEITSAELEERNAMKDSPFVRLLRFMSVVLILKGVQLFLEWCERRMFHLRDDSKYSATIARRFSPDPDRLKMEKQL